MSQIRDNDGNYVTIPTIDPVTGDIPAEVIPGGGGAISATDGVTTVDPATSIVFPSGTLTDLGGGAAGVGLLFRYIGPFRIDWTQEAAMAGAGLALAPLAAGSIVVRAWVEVVEQWNGSGSPSQFDYHLSIMVGTGVGGVRAILYPDLIDRNQSYPEIATSENIAASNSNLNISVVRVVAGDVSLRAAFQNFSGPLSAGAADIYAIIATPAS